MMYTKNILMALRGMSEIYPSQKLSYLFVFL